jgi:hypothetical protein
MATAEGREPAVNAVNPSTAPWLSHQLYFASPFHLGRAPFFLRDRCGELDWI